MLTAIAASGAMTDRRSWRTNRVHDVPVARWKTYRSPDRKLIAVVMRLKRILYGSGEGVVEIRDVKRRLLQTADYTDGGTQGYEVAKAAWTSDSRFFVFSTTSAGGHQPWRSPTHFYSRGRNQFCSLDSLRDTITTDEFRLKPPNRVLTEARFNRVTFDLGKLTRSQLDKAHKEELDDQHWLRRNE